MAISGSVYDLEWNPPPRKPRQAVGWDLDSTLCRTVHRRHLIPAIRAGQATWDDYSDLSGDDEPIAGAVALARMLWRTGHPQYAISGRSARVRDRTLSWMMRHDVPMDHVILRPEGDCTDNKLFKVQQLRELQAQGVEFCLFIEDWAPVAEFITEQTGISVLGVNPFDPDSALVTRDQLAVVLDELVSEGKFIEDMGPSAGWLADEIFPRLGGAF
jgi:hypothetical protein